MQDYTVKLAGLVNNQGINHHMQLLDIKKSFKDQDVDLEWSPPALTHASDRFSSHDAPDVQIKKRKWNQINIWLL